MLLIFPKLLNHPIQSSTVNLTYSFLHFSIMRYLTHSPAHSVRANPICRLWQQPCKNNSYLIASPHADTLSVFFRTGLHIPRTYKNPNWIQCQPARLRPLPKCISEFQKVENHTRPDKDKNLIHANDTQKLKCKQLARVGNQKCDLKSLL